MEIPLCNYMEWQLSYGGSGQNISLAGYYPYTFNRILIYIWLAYSVIKTDMDMIFFAENHVVCVNILHLYV